MIYILSLAAIFAIATFLLRRKSNAAKITLPADYKTLLSKKVVYYNKLDQDQKTQFETRLADFLKEVRIEGVGTRVTDLDRVLVASSALIPIFGFPGWKYQNLTNVILYPDTFDLEFQFEGGNRNILGLVGSGYLNGQMLLSRAALEKGFSDVSGKENTAIHEFVHLLDKSDGATDGIPENLLAHEYITPWLHLMHIEMHKISTGSSDINPYALTNEAEFFAVASEYFFEKPEQLKKKHPQLYEQLSRIFGQKPA